LLLVLLDRRKLVRRNDAPSRQLRAAYAALVLAFLATLAPWLVRNSIDLGRPEMIAGRGEGILGMRMIFDRAASTGIVLRFESSAIDGKTRSLTFYALSALSLLGLFGVFFGGLIAGNRVLIAAFGAAPHIGFARSVEGFRPSARVR
jgi:hypothetical protein